jgi:hypothetical protein
MSFWKHFMGVTVAAAVLLTGAFAGSAMAGHPLAPGKGGSGINQSPGQAKAKCRPGKECAPGQTKTDQPPGLTFGNPGRDKGASPS